MLPGHWPYDRVFIRLAVARAPTSRPSGLVAFVAASDRTVNDTNEVSPYEKIGGEEGVRNLVERFYDLMDELPEAAQVRALHPKDLSNARQKLFWYFSGWLGGPPLYVERFGHPRLRRRHMMVEIREAETEQWMLCMRRALDETVDDAELRTFLVARLEPLAHHMRNRPG